MSQAMTEIAGNRELCERLIEDTRSGSLSHAYIIEGASGSGRKTIALNVAAATACERLSDDGTPTPCLLCPSCKKILERKSTDVIFVKDETKASVGVDLVRFIREDVRIIPNDIDNKFYIIENADKMTEQAQNALLLTLEEPPSFARFFLICNDASSLLETIRSRAITLRTQRLCDCEVDSYISSHYAEAKQMKLASQAEYQELIKASAGGIGRAIEYLTDPKAWKTARDRREFIRTLASEALSGASPEKLIPLLTKLSSSRDALSEELSLFALAVRDLMVSKKSDSPTLEFYCDENEAIELSDKVSLSFLYTLYQNISIASEENARNANVRLLTTKLAINSKII